MKVTKELLTQALPLFTESLRLSPTQRGTFVQESAEGNPALSELLQTLIEWSTLIERQFRIEGVIGRGGFGMVLLAQDCTLPRRVAIKLLLLGADDDRLLREAQAVGQLQHRNIVTIHSFQTDVIGSGRVSSIVMEYIEGTTFRALLNTSPRPRAMECLRILEHTAAALDYAHSHNVLHRDVKPENILVSARDREVKLIDFGIGKLLTESATVTETGNRAGTPKYMAIEYLRDGVSLPAGDQSALGEVAKEVLTEPRAEFLKALDQERLLFNWLSPMVKALDRAVHPDPAKRYPSCLHFIAALRQVTVRTPEDVFAGHRAEDPRYPEGIVNQPKISAKTELNTKQIFGLDSSEHIIAVINLDSYWSWQVPALLFVFTRRGVFLKLIEEKYFVSYYDLPAHDFSFEDRWFGGGGRSFPLRYAHFQWIGRASEPSGVVISGQYSCHSGSGGAMPFHNQGYHAERLGLLLTRLKVLATLRLLEC